MKQIAIYLRLSLADSDMGEDGKEESNSIENQRLLIRNYLQSHKELLGDVVEYKDDGFSGLNFERPGFQKMIEDAKHGKISTIIVKDLSRFGRDYIGVGDYLEQILPSLGVRLIAINSRYDSQEQGASILSLEVSINNMINNMYSKDLSKKLRSSFRAKWHEGQNPSSGMPYGYIVDEKCDKGHIIKIDDEAAENVRLIFQLAIAGCSTKMIAEKLNEKGIPTPLMYRVLKGRMKVPSQIRNLEEQLWSTHNVLNIIKNYDYTGTRIHGKKEYVFVGGKKTKRVPLSDCVIVEDNHPAIVSKEDFALAQEVIKSKKPPQNWNKRGDAFSGKLRCGCCGSSLQLIQNYENLIYCEHSLAIGSKSKCNKDVFNRDVIINTVIFAIRKNVEELTEVRDNLIEKSKITFSSYETEITDANSRLKDISDELARQYENYVNGHLHRERFIELKKKLTEKRKEIEEKLKTIEAQKESSDGIAFELNRMVNIGQAFFQKDTIPDDIVNAFLKDVKVYAQDRIEIRLNTTDLYERALSQIN